MQAFNSPFINQHLLIATHILVAMRLGDTPVLIPNTMVKTQAANGTILETVWKSRWLPDLFKKIAEKRLNKYWFYQ